MANNNQRQGRITSIMRWINGEPIYFFPYCLVGKKGMVKAFYKGAFINVYYKDALKSCDKACVSAKQWALDKTAMDRQLERLGIRTRGVSKTSMKLGIYEKLPS